MTSFKHGHSYFNNWNRFHPDQLTKQRPLPSEIATANCAIKHTQVKVKQPTSGVKS